MFEIPVALILFRRNDTLPKIIARIRTVRPRRIYLLADEGRNEEEREQAHTCRTLAEALIDWECEVIKYYAEENRGVYGNIGKGAQWVFNRERYAIFIEDDNLPEETFFEYAKELLYRYESNPKVMWICGTNYYTEMNDRHSYEFTQHLLPCGWASWSEKFLTYYDGELKLFGDRKMRRSFLKSYNDRWLARWQFQAVRNEYERYQKTGKFLSWDYQMVWSVRAQNLLGIVPMRNQITNIGIDEFSVHGGCDRKNVMTSRFCKVPSKPMRFPLLHPASISINRESEGELSEVICPPHFTVLKSLTGTRLKKALGIDISIPWKQILSHSNSLN